MTWMRFIFAIALALVSFTDLMEVQAKPAKSISPTAFSVRQNTLKLQRKSTTVKFIQPLLSNRGAPSGRRRGGASRGGCPAVENSLTALVPATEPGDGRHGKNSMITSSETVWAITAAKHPTFWFYIPYSLTPEHTLEFVLQDEQDNYIYKTTFAAPGTPPGIASLSLPSVAAPLEIGKQYHWFFSIYCDPQRRAKYVYVNGSVERIALDGSGMSQLAQVSPREQIALYAANGLWHEALTNLAELHRTNPKDAALATDWDNLLSSVGLDAIISKPIVRCCTPKQ